MVKGNPKQGTVINRIKEVITEQGRSQVWLAEQLGYNVNSVASICNNLSQPYLKDLPRFAKALNVKVIDLLDKNYLNSMG